MLKKINYCCLFVISMVVGLSLVSCGKDKKPEKVIVRPVNTIVVGEPQKYILRNFPGKVIASKKANLSFNIRGQLIKLPVLEGTIVQKGGLIAAIDPKKFQEKVNETNAVLVKARGQYNRAKQLIKGRYISDADYDAKRSEYLSAKANNETAKRDLRDTKLYAPFPGIVAKKYVENYEYVTVKQKIVALHDLYHVDVEINVPENIMIHLKKEAEQHKANGKDKVVVKFEAFPKKEFKVRFKEFSSKADPETQTYRVVFIMPRPKEINVLPGMTATIKTRLPDYSSDEAKYISIPSSAVFNDEQKQSSVWVVNSDTMTVHRKPVKISQLEAGKVRVLSGIKPGDRIVIAGANFLREGEKIKLLEPRVSDPDHK